MSADELTVLGALATAPVDERPELQAALLPVLLVELQAPPRLRDRLQVPRVRVRVRRVGYALAAAAVAVAGVLAVVELRGRFDAPVPPIIEQPSEDDPSDPVLPEDALGVVLDARARWLADPRPVHATTVVERVEEDGRSSVTQTEIWFRDEAAWRTVSATAPSDGTPYDTTTVWDGRRELVLGDLVEGRPAAQLTTYQAVGRHPFGTPLRDWAASAWTWERRCGDGELFADAEVAGQVARHVRCGSEELWLDAETGLLLRHERPAGADDVDLAEQSFEVTGITWDPVVPTDTFRAEPPTGLPMSEFAELPSLLQPRDAAPPFEARTVDGELVDLASLRGGHVLVVFWSPGLFDLGTVEQVHRSGAEDLTVLVHDPGAVDVGRASAFMAAHGYTVPLVVDAAPPSDDGLGPIARTWWSSGEEPPAGSQRLAQLWVLVGPDGDVVATRSGNLLPEDLEAWLDDAGVERGVTLRPPS